MRDRAPALGISLFWLLAAVLMLGVLVAVIGGFVAEVRLAGWPLLLVPAGIAAVAWTTWLWRS